MSESYHYNEVIAHINYSFSKLFLKSLQIGGKEFAGGDNGKEPKS